MTAILADTGPLHALVDPDDQYHSQAQAEAQRISDEDLTVGVSYPILLEAYTLVLQRLGIRVARVWIEEVMRGSALLSPSKGDYTAAIHTVKAYKDQPITLFDAVTAKLSSELGWPVWTYDYHFDLMQISVWR